MYKLCIILLREKQKNYQSEKKNIFLIFFIKKNVIIRSLLFIIQHDYIAIFLKTKDY